MMHSLRRFAAAFVVGVAITAAGCVAARAQTVPEPRIAVVDLQFVQQKSTAMIDIQAQLEQRRKVYQDEINVKERELRAADQELARQSSVLAAEALTQRRREFEARVAEVQRDVQRRKRELDQAYDAGRTQVQRAVIGIIAELAKTRGFNLVLLHQQIVFADNALNISDEVLQLLNERLPRVEVPAAQN